MHKSSPPKYLIKGNLSEKQIEADVSSYFGWCTPIGADLPFRLLDVNEQETGADKKFDGGRLIFMQFKKSTGLKSIATVAPSTRRDRSLLEDIRIYRAKESLEDDPSLFFQLHARAKTAVDLQHNVLLQYERPPLSRAIYVAPLLLDKDSYHRALFSSSERFLTHPFYYRPSLTIAAQNWIHHFGAIPFLREHVSITPHERVTDHHHFFAYSGTGTDVSWHSPSLIDRGPSRLSDFMVSTLRESIAGVDSMGSIETLAKVALELGRSLGFDPGRTALDDEPMVALARHGAWLSATHGIRQMLLLGNKQWLAEAYLRSPF